MEAKRWILSAFLIQDLAQARRGFSDSAQKVFTNADRYVTSTLMNWARTAQGFRGRSNDDQR